MHLRLVFLCLLCLSISARAAGQRPNIIFIFSDDHAYQAVSAYGGKLKLNETPNIDRIAHEGMLFRQCYVNNSICGPMRAVIQTGKYSHKNGFLRNGNKFNGHQQTFPKLLKAAGYETAVVGKWHLGEHMPPQGYSYSEVLVGQGPYYNPPMLLDENGDGTRKRVKHIGYTTDIISKLTLNWLKNTRDKSKPFMLMTQHKAPHRNWQPGPKYLTKWDGVDLPEPPTLFEDYSKRLSPARTQEMQIDRDLTRYDLKLDPPRGLTKEQLATWNAAYGPKNRAFEEAKLTGKELVRWKYQRYIKDYLRSIQSVDDAVGELLAYLDESGLAKNTIIIYCSDQGFYLGEHGWFDKRWIYEESLRTPFMVRWPGVVKAGSQNHDIVSPLDFAETFCEVAGIDVPSDMQGRSLVAVLKGKTPKDWRKSFYYHYYEYPGWHLVRRHYGVADGRYKLVRFYEKDVDAWELIDLKADPLEQKNFYGQKKYAQVQKRLHAELKRLRTQYDVPDSDPAQSFEVGDTPARYQQRKNK
ncbi:MAG: sulfatase [Verrucomicrobiales bacterium]|nr:sulfatase [Verrucomicrobiales bacterium]|tara:strand:+ start:251 stop:1822 length:1572 start_codon:yes stop_codon:yes gene_type:complete